MWVLDLDGRSIVYYDAPPDIAAALLQAASIRIRRGDALRTVTPTVTRVDTVPADRQNQVYAAMMEKYGERNSATDIFYRYLGRSRDRVAVLIDYPQ